MKINIIRDENGRIVGIDASSESSDGHLSSEEKQILTDVLNKDHQESLKRIEEESKTKQKMYEESTAKHKEWANASSTIITCFCKSVASYLKEKEIYESAKPSVDHLDLTGPEELKEQMFKENIDNYKRYALELLKDNNTAIDQAKNEMAS